MADQLKVDTGRLRSGAAESARIAGLLTRSSTNSAPQSGQPSSSGITAMDAAISATRGRQAARVALHVDKMAAAASSYDEADGRTAEAVAQTL
jgi:hypothetical protein